jgi:peptidoglycan/LPS O-acetylase OafA/YrhL
VSEASTGSSAQAAGPIRVRPRLEYIDGLRALAATWVALHHVFETATPKLALSIPVVGAIVGSLNLGQFPVMVFLMLSGFCLYYPYVRKDPQPRFTGFVQYLVRRWTRIAPPYLATGALCLVLIAIPSLQIGRWSQTGPVDFATIVTHLLFIHNLSPLYSVKIDYPMWSIGLEWQLYLLFPIFVWSFRRLGAAKTIVASLALTAVVRLTYHRLPDLIGTALREGPFAYLEIFSAGMLAAALTVRGHRLPSKWLLGAVLLAGAIAVRLSSGNGLAHDLAASAAAFCALLLAADPNSATARILSRPGLVRIGFFSYSIYLMHAPLLHLFWLLLRPLHWSDDVQFFVLSLFGLPLIFALCYGFHCLFERPFMRVKAAVPAAAPPRVESAVN